MQMRCRLLSQNVYRACSGSGGSNANHLIENIVTYDSVGVGVSVSSALFGSNSKTDCNSKAGELKLRKVFRLADGLSAFWRSHARSARTPSPPKHHLPIQARAVTKRHDRQTGKGHARHSHRQTMGSRGDAEKWRGRAGPDAVRCMTQPNRSPRCHHGPCGACTSST